MHTNREINYVLARDKAAETLRSLTPELVAYRSETVFQSHVRGRGEFLFSFWDQPHTISFPEAQVREVGSVAEPSITMQILLLHYLVTSDGEPLADRWVNFRELPGGLMYDPAFQGRSGDRIAGMFGRDKESFSRAARALGGLPLTYGDAGFLFRLLPRLPVAVILNLADDEFPADARVLFDAHATHYLPIEDLAVVGGIVASRMSKQRG